MHRMFVVRQLKAGAIINCKQPKVIFGTEEAAAANAEVSAVQSDSCVLYATHRQTVPGRTRPGKTTAATLLLCQGEQLMETPNNTAEDGIRDRFT